MKQTLKILKISWHQSPAKTKPRKSKLINVISEQETSDTTKPNETDNSPTLSVIQEKEINLFSKSSKWEHLSEFEDMISDSSHNDYCHGNFRKTIYIDFCHILQFGKAN